MDRGPGNPSGPQLPAELVRAVFCSPPLRYSIKDWLRGRAVCNTWRAALASPFPSLAICHDTELALLDWVILRRPAFEEVWVAEDLAEEPPEPLLPALLHSVAREAVKELHFLDYDCSVAHVLPCPAAFANLERLMLWTDVDRTALPRWLPRLAALERLQGAYLQLHNHNQNAEPLRLPALAALTSLTLDLNAPTRVSVPLRGLGELRRLRLLGNGYVDLAGGSGAGGAASQLTYLDSVDTLTVDFAALPALARLKLGGIDLIGASTLAAAQALTRVELGLWDDQALQRPWAAELLRHAPRALRALGLRGPWSQDLAAAVGNLGQLELLAVSASETCLPLPAGAALWCGLRELWLEDVRHSSPLLPEALRHASRLERLHFASQLPPMADLCTLAALPALRQLWFVGLAEGPAAAATLAAARAALPGVTVQQQAPAKYEDIVTAALGGPAEGEPWPFDA